MASYCSPTVYLARGVYAIGMCVITFDSRVRPVCTENSNPDVVVMESAEDGERFDTPGPLNRARDRRIFIQ